MLDMVMKKRMEQFQMNSADGHVRDWTLKFVAGSW